jgi:hypothetical protein
MSNYPIIEQRSLAKAERGKPWGIGPRTRAASDLPLPNAHEAVVYKSGGRYVIDDGNSRLDDDHVRNATNITVVDMRVNAPVLAQLPIPAAGGAEFTVQVTFWCTVRKPDVVADAGLHDLTASLVLYLKQHQPLNHVGERAELDDVNQVRGDVNAAIRAYATHRPPDFPGLEVAVGSVEVLTPAEFAEFEHERRGRQRQGQLSSEEERQKHSLDAEKAELKQIRDSAQQRFDQQLAAQQASNQQVLDEMRQQYEDTLARMRQRTANDLQSTQVRHEQVIEAESLDHQQRMRSAAIDSAIDGATRLAGAIGAGQSEMHGLIATAAGEITMTEASSRLATDREHLRQVAAEDSLRQRTWEREDAREAAAWKRDDERQVRAWDRSDKRLQWAADHEDADRQFKFKIAELQAQADVISAGIARGLFDHQTFDKVMSAVSGLVRELESASKDGKGLADRADTVADDEPSPAADRMVKGDVLTDTAPAEGERVEAHGAIREEDYG